MKLKAKVDFTSKAGEIEKGNEFTTDASHGEFLVNMKYAEKMKESKEELAEEVPPVKVKK